ncbi:IS630-like element ISDra3 family transposase [Desulfothermus naphthae]
MKGERIKVKNAEELKEKLKGEKKDNILVKLIFLNLIREGIDFEKACSGCGIAQSTGYLWIREWNQEGYKGIKGKGRGKGGGRPNRLSEEDLKKLKELLKKRAYWTTKEVRALIKDTFDIEYSQDHVVRILRDKLKMHFSKPYPMDYRKPKDGEKILENQLQLTFSLLKEKGFKEEEIAIGFIDETSPQNTANTVRVWSFEKTRIIKNTTKFKTNTIGFYAIKGESVKSFLEDSKGLSIAKFLEKIREVNKKYKAIVAIIDNFSSHKSKVVREKASELDIYLVYLPPYSPELNPIEYIWKSIKRVLSLVFVKDIKEMEEVISEAWNRLCKKLSFAKSWIEKFLKGTPYYMKLCG